MDQFLARFPTWFVALVILGGALIFIYFANPPKTVCDIQIEQFEKTQKEFLFPVQGAAVVRRAMVEEQMDGCLVGNTPGSCLEFFNRTSKMLQSLDLISNECQSQALESPTLKYMWRIMKVMVQVAWGDKPPVNLYVRQGFLDASDLSIFCRLKIKTQRLFGTEQFNEQQTQMVSKLPGANKLNPRDAWEKSIFSIPCNQYR